MPEDTKAKSDKTSEEEGKNTDDSAKGKDTDTSKENQDTDKKFTQADIDRVAKKTRAEEKAKFETAQAEATRLAEEAEATKQGEFEKLANSRQAELDELKPKLETATTELNAYKLKVAEMVAADLKELPEEVRDMSPAQLADDKSITNPLDVLAWLPKGKALAEKLNGQTAVKGAKPSPRANGAHGDPDADKRAKAEARRAYRD